MYAKPERRGEGQYASVKVASFAWEGEETGGVTRVEGGDRLKDSGRASTPSANWQIPFH